MDEPGSDTCPHNVDKEVANGKEPGEGVLEALLCQGFHDAGLVLGSSHTHRHRWTHPQYESVWLFMAPVTHTATDGIIHSVRMSHCPWLQFNTQAQIGSSTV